MRILIVDDHQLFIDGIRHIITTLDRDIDVLEATSADLALQALSDNADLDLVLLDLHMPGLNGGSLVRHPLIQQRCLPVVIISGEDDPRSIKSVIDAGVMGFIPKSYSAKKLINALRTVMEGEIFLPEGLREQLQGHSVPGQEYTHSAEVTGGSDITRRQYQVLQLLAHGKSNKQISRELFLTENTVKAHVSALLRSLGASNRTECVSIARSKGLIG